MVDQDGRWTTSRGLLSTLQDLAILAARPLRKKAVLFVILAISVIYCILSLVHIHFINSGSHRRRVSAKTSGDEYDVSSVLDRGDEHQNVIPPPPNLFSRGANSQSQSSHSSHDEFAFLKRQHKLKEGEKLEANGAHQVNADHHNPNSHLENGPTVDESIFSGSSSGGIKCRNSIQGKYLIADDRGYVCPRRFVGINGCCSTTSNSSKTKLYSCETCDQPSGCCSSYEYCISCCMAPEQRELLNRMVGEKRSAVFRIFIANITDYFELCLTKCRTFSGSVQHENTYRNAVAKHCYSDIGL